MIPNCRVVEADIKAVEVIFGPEVRSLKGKTAQRKPPWIHNNFSPAPAAILERYWHETLCVDINRNLPKVEFLGLVVAMSAAKCNLNCVTNFMQPICILHNFVFSDIKTCQNMSKSHIFIDLTSQAPLGHV